MQVKTQLHMMNWRCWCRNLFCSHGYLKHQILIGYLLFLITLQDIKMSDSKESSAAPESLEAAPETQDAAPAETPDNSSATTPDNSSPDNSTDVAPTRRARRKQEAKPQETQKAEQQPAEVGDH